MKNLTCVSLLTVSASILALLTICNLWPSTDPAIALGVSGTILISDEKTPDGRPIVRSLLPNGTPNAPFALAQETSAPNIEANVLDLIVLSDGSIVQAGSALEGSNVAYLFIKTLSSGLTDTNFGASGVSQILQGSLSVANAVVDVLSGSGLVGCGRATVNRNPAASVILLDATSGSEIATNALSVGGRPQFNAIVRTSTTGTVASAGFTTEALGGARGLLAQYIVSPTALMLDVNFGISGSVLSNDSLPTIYLDLDIDTAGDLVVLGLQECDPIVRRYSSTGLLDLSFGLSGTANVSDLIAANAGFDLGIALNALELQSDNAIVLVGRTSNQHLLATRIAADGSSLDATFGSSGVYLYNSSLPSNGTDVAIDATGSIFIAADLDCPEAAVLKLSVSGLVDLEFGTNGIASDVFTLLSPAAVLEEREPSGISSTGSFPSPGTTITRNLNSIMPPGGTDKVQLNPLTNEFTVQPGTYLISAEAPAVLVNGHKVFIDDITHGVIVALGTSVTATLMPTLEFSYSMLSAIITVTEETTFRLRQSAIVTVGTGSAGTALGLPGLDEVYAKVTIQELVPVCPLQASSQCVTQET